ncbi:Acyltransferase family protein [Olavius algarvensis Delta 1 endosymbiont]|nr:Acyltransferase family protein [Olavius algarvensis Delta 1 endosymbiont]
MNIAAPLKTIPATKKVKHTIFDTPVLEAILHRASRLILSLAGWQTEGRLPLIPKFVLVGAPHTSNWDLPFTLLMAFALRARIRWMGKTAIFRWPFKGFFQWLGGIPVKRSQADNLVEQSIQQFERNDHLILTIAPAGTRKHVLRWKSGFYHIACGAGVPIVLGFLDYRRKTGGFGPLVHPTGNIAADMQTIRAFYDGVTGKNPAQPMI